MSFVQRCRWRNALTFKTSALASGVRDKAALRPAHFRTLHSDSHRPGEVAATAASTSPGTSSFDVAEDVVEAVNQGSAIGSGLLSATSDAFLALPPALGGISYAATIVIMTIALRSTITLPMIAWQRRRVRRVQELVVPAAKEWMSSAKYALRAEYRKANKGYDQYVAALNVQAKKQFKILAAKYRCRPLPTMLLPPLLHLPIFIGATLTIREACNRSFTSLQSSVQALESGAADLSSDNSLSSLALESLAWCPSLADVDPYSALPVAVGVTALLNVEVQARIRQALAELRENVLDASGDSASPGPQSERLQVNTTSANLSPLKRPARPSPSIPSVLRKKTFATTPRRYAAEATRTPQLLDSAPPPIKVADTSVASAARSRAITNVLRFGSILFIPIAAASPVAVNVYWLTSNIFSLAQNLVLGYRDRSRRMSSQ